MSRRLRAAVLCMALLALAAPSAASADNYVALGDSYSSGVGTNSYTLSSSCLRGVYAYPYVVSQQRPNTSLNFVACSGATTTSLMSSQIQAVNASTNAVIRARHLRSRSRARSASRSQAATCFHTGNPGSVAKTH